MDRMCSLRRAQKGEWTAVSILMNGEKDALLQALYERALQEGRLHVLRVDGSEEIVGAVVIGDAADAQEKPAIALSGIRTDEKAHGAYDAMLSACELIGKLRGKESLIMTCSQEDEALAAFCAKRGFAQTERRAGETGFERPIEQGCSCGG